ncbi:response regulator [Paraburkholderia acidisoli]|uniref:Response regulator n=1 Tax=Paraburkholderia acidisoli TaxID=2571748 RepID=A0A7Z2JKZ6_9BURK|nr:response regulator [Paraburkholderia acidisoli]QGZ66819.1 response regulator [Paraburkholderia acidisoli]
MSTIVRQPVFHPVSVVFLDDSPDFLYALRGLFPGAGTDRYFTHASEALGYVRSHEPRQRVHNPTSGEAWSEFEKKGGNALGQDVMTDTARFNDIAAIVVDYEMPEMNGIEFLTAVKDVACARILLTATANESHAVDAFNAGLIDFYVKKSDPEMPRKLSGAIADAKRKFCARRGHIGVHDVGAIYANRHVAEALHEVVQRERIVEYYWRPEQNAVLTFDAEGSAGVFLAWDSHDWAAQCDVVTDEGGPAALREEMAARRIMPVYWPNEAYRPGMSRVEFATPEPVPGLDDTFTSWTRIGDAGLPSGLVTFAAWRSTQDTNAMRDGIA